MIVVVFLTSVLLAVAYRQLKRIIGVRLALLTILFVAVEPFYLALSRALHTDAIISLFMFISVLYFYNYLLNSRKDLIVSDGIFAGLFAGLAFLTKSSALFLLPFFLLIAVIYFAKTKNIYAIYKTLTVFSISVVTFFVFWPAMWVQPIESLNLYLFEGVQDIAILEGHEHVWFGKITSDPGSAFYPIVLVGRYSVLLFLSLFFSVYLLYRNKSRVSRDKTIDLILTLLLFVFFYILMITLVSKKLDRYSLPIVFPLSVLASWVISEILNKRILVVFISVLVIMRLLLFYGIHPNYLAYYSPLIGGIEGGRYILEPKWLIGYDEVAEYFNEKQKDQEDPIKVAIADYDYLRPFAKFEVLNIKHDEERNAAEYFVLPVFRPERNKFYEETHKLLKLNTTIKIAGVDYYYIYKAKNRSVD
jgi:4-amino-4-deoxy-L-arabinose transferase-like glycosyltransferase